MKSRSRREFIHQSMLASASAFAASQLDSSGFAQEAAQQPAEQQKPVGPNEMLSVAIIGANPRTGRGDASHRVQLQGGTHTTVTYICDVDEANGQRVCENTLRDQGTKPNWVADMRRVFDDKSVDIVTIATPNHWHSLAAIWALQAGKDVYVEKPVSHNVSEGRRLVQTAAKYNRVIQVGTQCRSNPGMIELMKFVHDGNLGKVKVARGLCYKRRPSIGPKGIYQPPETVDYNLWLGPAPDKPLTRPKFHYDWHWQWDYGCGDLGNQGIHQMDLCRWALGKNELSQKVMSYGGRFGYEDAGETANTQVVIFDYDDQQLIFEVHGLDTKRYRTVDVGMIVECTEGYILNTSYNSGIAFDLEGNQIKRFSGGNDKYHFDNFVNTVVNRKVEELNGKIEDGHLSSALCHLGNISLRLGHEIPASELPGYLKSIQGPENHIETLERTMTHLKENNVDTDSLKVLAGPQLVLDPVTETFKSSNAAANAANAMLTRDYRAPFVVPSAANV